MATSEIEIIKNRVLSLSQGEKIQLIEYLTKTVKNDGPPSQPLQFGKYRNSGKRESTADDFQIAEWPGDALDLNAD